MSGVLYFLINRAMPGLVKIGYTENQLQDRLLQLNSTGVPTSFEVLASFMVDDVVSLEKEVHEHLEQFRYSSNREFFQIEPIKALNESWPLILEKVSNNLVGSTNGNTVKKESHNIENKTIILLQSLADYNRNVGYRTEQLTDINPESEIEVENRLATLQALGLVEERKIREDWQGSQWKITSKGVKFLFDNDLVEDYMKENRF